MIKVYLAGIPSPYEGEDIEVQYCIYDNQERLCKETIMIGYKKPAIIGQVALITLLKRIEKDKRKKIEIIVNDAALSEIVRGTSTTKNADVLKMVDKMRSELNKFENCVIKDISRDQEELAKWKEALQRE